MEKGVSGVSEREKHPKNWGLGMQLLKFEKGGSDGVFVNIFLFIYISFNESSIYLCKSQIRAKNGVLMSYLVWNYSVVSFDL